VLQGGAATADATISAFDKVSESSFAKEASSLVKAKPTIVATGDTSALPHADELGL